MHSNMNVAAESSPSRMKTVGWIAVAWLPLFLLWCLFILTYTPSRPLGGVLLGALNSVGWAGLLGIGAWWLTGRFPWPEALRPRFYLLHLLAGVLYATLWVIATYTVGALLDGQIDILQRLRSSRVLGWQFILGLVLYGLVAGISYAVRTRRRLQEQERLAARAEALAVEARLRALRAKLHPHFLFNCLHSLSSLVGENPAGAGRAVERLGDLLRYTLDEDDRDTVPLSEEWAFTRDYLELERLRYGDRLSVEPDLDEIALSCQVPPFTLQPLVENAVRHAVAERSKGGVIRVTARRDDVRLRLRVADDGPGIDAPSLDRAHGHGLRSIRQRLRYLYDGRAELTIETSPGAGFAVSLYIPAEGLAPGPVEPRRGAAAIAGEARP